MRPTRVPKQIESSGGLQSKEAPDAKHGDPKLHRKTLALGVGLQALKGLAIKGKRSICEALDCKQVYIGDCHWVDKILLKGFFGWFSSTNRYQNAPSALFAWTSRGTLSKNSC
jgi:hypothetical protein